MKLPHSLRRFHDLILQSGSAAIGLGAIVAVWVTLVWTSTYVRETALDNAQEETTNLARMFEEQITRAVKAVDQSMMFVRDSWARDPGGFDVTTWARSASAVTDVAIQLTIVGRDGWTRLNSALPASLPVNLSDREHIRFQIDTPGDTLFISKPVIGRVSHRWSLQFTRKLFDANGAFDGVAVISLDPSYLTRFYASIELGKTGRITLFGTDGVVRAAARADLPDEPTLDVGKVVHFDPASETTLHAGAAVGPVDFDDIRRITSFRTVRAYPLVVSVGLGEDEVLADPNLLRRNGGFGALVLTVFLAAATLGMLLHQHRHAIARARLRESERLYAEKSLILETALEHMSQGIVMIDGERRLKVYNRRLLAMLNLPQQLMARGPRLDEVIRYQMSVGEFDAEAEDQGEGALTFIHQGGLSNVPQTYERKRPSGATLEVRSMPLQDGGVVRTFTDISVRKAFEEDLRAARDQAHSAARAKSEFLAMMSHEIRSPLSGLVGALDLLRLAELGADEAHMVKLAHGSAHNLLAILNDILDFSKIEAGALTTFVELVDIRALVSDLTEPHALVAQSKGVSLQAEVDASVPALIRTDPLRLGQIVTNLLGNAVKFTAHGSVALSAACERTGDADHLRIAVRDTGSGMDAATLERLFQPFTQADGSSSRIAGGTGLGLCISRRLAHLLDGILTVTSEPGEGSCFTLLIRCAVERDAAVPLPLASPLDLDRVLAGRHVLVVDDNPANQWLTRRQLFTLGATVETASHGQAALDLLDRSRFDAIVTDCHMPGMDGVALTAAIRGGGMPWHGCPIVGLTADVTREQARRCTESGMDELLYKPVSRVRLAQVLGQTFGQALGQGGATAIAVAPDADPEATAEAAAFDPTTYRDLFEPEDPEGTAWLGGYCASAAAQVRALGRFARAPSLDREALEAAAHMLVGASLSVGAARLAQAVRALETAAADADAGRLAAMVAGIEAERRAAAAAMAPFLAGSVRPAWPAGARS